MPLELWYHYLHNPLKEGQQVIFIHSCSYSKNKKRCHSYYSTTAQPALLPPYSIYDALYYATPPLTRSARVVAYLVGWECRASPPLPPHMSDVFKYNTASFWNNHCCQPSLCAVLGNNQKQTSCFWCIFTWYDYPRQGRLHKGPASKRQGPAILRVEL